MNKSEEHIIEQISKTLDNILHGKKPNLIEFGDCGEPLNTHIRLMNEFILSFYEIWDFILPLSNGSLNIEPPKSKNIIAFPFKELHSQLRNLVWQVQQVAKGDYKQKVYFMGEFAEAFNKMVDALQEKHKRDINERKKLEDIIQYLENYDALTKIPNRNSLEKTFEEFFSHEEKCINGAILILDVDNLRFINETFDHAIGDMVLINIATILKENLNGINFLTRLGGDEFLVLLKDVSISEANSIAENLKHAVKSAKFYPNNYKYEVSCTICMGIVPFSNRNLNLKEIMSLANYALYKAKDQGRNSVYLITEELRNTKNNEINSLLYTIKNAIETESITLYFQPVVDVTTGKVIHHEALMRILSNNEIIYPDKVLPIAERFGLMLQIDKAVLKQSFNFLKKYPKLRLFINLSGSSIGDDEILNNIIDNLNIMNIDPSRVGFEITETMAIKNLSHSDKWIRKLREIGCKFALDDFGIGFSTFSYLRYLSVDYVKIDGSYVRDIEKNNQNRALVQAINTVAISLGKQVVAEYVENNLILDILKEDGISLAQGYYFGKPEETPKWF